MAIKYQGLKKCFLCLGALFSTQALAIDFIPATVEPGRVAQEVTTEGPRPRAPLAPRTVTPEEQPLFPKEIASIKFVLKGFKFKGNTRYSDEELLALFPKKVGTTVTIGDIEKFVNAITLKYNNAGYVLSQAIIPEQTIATGIVHITIVEGFIDKVIVEGDVSESTKLKIKRYGDKVVGKKPLNFTELESAMLLVNDLPGMQVQSIIRASKTVPAAANLTLVVTHHYIDNQSYLSYDNRGTRYIGPTRTILSAFLNTTLGSGAATGIRISESGQFKQMQYFELEHKQYLGTNGLMLDFDAQNTRTEPGFLLEGTDTVGYNKYFAINAQYPLMRQRIRNFYLTGGFNYINSSMNQFGFKIYNDLIRTVEFGFSTDFADEKGASQISGYVTQGLSLFGASQPGNLVSRFKAKPIFSKFNLNAVRLHALYKNISLMLSGAGQYATNRMYAYEQLGYGGIPFGNAYDPSEIVGDRGVEAKIELRLDTTFPISSIPTQYFVYFDEGTLWNYDHILQEGRGSGTSTGFGLRSTAYKYLNISLELDKPLNRNVAVIEAEPNGGNPRQWRGFFSVVLMA